MTKQYFLGASCISCLMLGCSIRMVLITNFLCIYNGQSMIITSWKPYVYLYTSYLVSIVLLTLLAPIAKKILKPLPLTQDDNPYKVFVDDEEISNAVS